MSKEWDEKHLAADPSPPLPLVMDAARRLTPGRALDLACGTGRHAIWLAQQGWDVTAVDSSPVAIGILRREAGRLPVRAILADLEAAEFPLEPASWDLIIVTLYLQRDLIARLGQALRPGGLAVVTTLMGDGRFRLKPRELRACFSGWETLHYSEGEVAEFVGSPGTGIS